MAVLHHWDTDAKHDAELFDLTPPKGAKKVEIAPVEPEKKP
jgi:hypothetical protein